jgi:hypothetical protein
MTCCGKEVVVGCVQGSTVFEMRYLATIVSNCFLAFGEILQMQTRVKELSAAVSRVAQLLATAEAAEDLQRECTASNITGVALPAGSLLPLECVSRRSYRVARALDSLCRFCSIDRICVGLLAGS